MKNIVILLVLCLISSVAFSGQRASFAPENNVYIGVNDKFLSAIDKTEFNRVIDKFLKVYGPIVAADGYKLAFERKWDDGTANAYTQLKGKTRLVTMFGGLARLASNNSDGFAAVICHEIGHHLGGAPKKSSWFGTAWASAEGQADYFATVKCLRRYFADEDNEQVIAGLNIDQTIIAKCEQAHGTGERGTICKRTAQAGQTLGNVLNELMNNTTPVSVNTPDTTVVTRTNARGYPSVQCRVDTYFAGALCDKEVDDRINDRDINSGQCSRAAGYSISARPTCWYKP